MDITLFFAKAYAIYFVVVGLALMFNAGRFRAWYNDIMAEDRRAMFGGVIALMIGCFIIASHNVWVMDWPVLITLIGYWGVFKGAGLLIFRDFVNIFRPMIGAGDMVYRLSGLAWILVGLLLGYHGFMG